MYIAYENEEFLFQNKKIFWKGSEKNFIVHIVRSWE